jgi:hypothetical protein
VPTSTNNLTSKNIAIKFYPNPMSEYGTIQVKGVEPINYDLYIHNQLGQVVFKKKNIKTSAFNMERNTLEAGLYFYSISINAGKTTYQNKFVVK